MHFKGLIAKSSGSSEDQQNTKNTKRQKTIVRKWKPENKASMKQFISVRISSAISCPLNVTESKAKFLYNHLHKDISEENHLTTWFCSYVFMFETSCFQKWVLIFDAQLGLTETWILGPLRTASSSGSGRFSSSQKISPKWVFVWVFKHKAIKTTFAFRKLISDHFLILSDQ